MEPCPVSWKVITEREKIMTRAEVPNWGSLPPNNFITDIVNYTLTLPSNIQHLPVFGPSAYSVRQFPAPAVRGLTDMYHQALSATAGSPYARAAYTGLLNFTSSVLGDELAPIWKLFSNYLETILQLFSSYLLHFENHPDGSELSSF